MKSKFEVLEWVHDVIDYTDAVASGVASSAFSFHAVVSGRLPGESDIKERFDRWFRSEAEAKAFAAWMATRLNAGRK